MHNGTRTKSDPAARAARVALAALLAAALTGCQYIVFIPLLIITPFMPLIQFAITMAARYGPMLLLLMADADQSASPTGPPTMIAAEPASAIEQTSLPDLEAQITNKLAVTRGLRAVSIVEAGRLTPAWLGEQCRLARAKGCTLRMVFVDSRRFASGDMLKPATRAALDAAGVRLQAGEGLAAHVAGEGAEILCLDAPQDIPDAGTAALMASLAGAIAEPAGGDPRRCVGASVIAEDKAAEPAPLPGRDGGSPSSLISNSL